MIVDLILDMPATLLMAIMHTLILIHIPTRIPIILTINKALIIITSSITITDRSVLMNVTVDVIGRRRKGQSEPCRHLVIVNAAERENEIGGSQSGKSLRKCHTFLGTVRESGRGGLSPLGFRLPMIYRDLRLCTGIGNEKL